MKDAFGNFVIQKILEKGSPDQKETLYSFMKGKIIELSIDSFGCRVIQKALEVWSGNIPVNFQGIQT